MKVLLFRVHSGDPLSQVIEEVTRTDYTHAAILIDEDKKTICEAYVPHVRIRDLADSELSGIDAFDVDGLDSQKSAGILGYCKQATAEEEPYSIANLFRFNPFFRKFIGEAYDSSTHDPVICSQFVFDAVYRGGGIKLLNAPSFKVAPGILAWSTLLHPAPPLMPTAESPGSASPGG